MRSGDAHRPEFNGAAGAARRPPAARAPHPRTGNRSWFAVRARAHPSARDVPRPRTTPPNHRTVLLRRRYGDGRLDTLPTTPGCSTARRGAGRKPTRRLARPRAANAAMTYDAARHVVVIFGGRSGSSVLGDTWTWDGTNWTEAPPADRRLLRAGTTWSRTTPPGHARCSTTADDGRTWLWDGADWAHVSTPRRRACAPDPRWPTTRSRKRVVLFGGMRPTGELPTFSVLARHDVDEAWSALVARRDARPAAVARR